MERFYQRLNILVAGAILLFLLMCGFWGNRMVRPSTCIHQELLGKKCPVCNTAGGIYSIERFQFEKARQLQQYSFRAFSFLILILAMRVAILFALRAKMPFRSLMSIDIAVTFILVISLLGSYLAQVGYIFYKMILTGR